MVGLFTDNVRIGAALFEPNGQGGRIYFTELLMVADADKQETSSDFPGFKMLVWFLYECQVTPCMTLGTKTGTCPSCAELRLPSPCLLLA